jgi:hypothetical protein
MSLTKAVPNSFKDCKCKRIALCKGPLIPYVPEKECVQEMVLSFKDQHLKTQIGKRYGTLSFYLALGMREASTMHMRSALEAIKKKGYFKAHKGANVAYVEQRNLVKQAKAALAKLDGTTSEGTGSSRKSSKKPKETAATDSQPDPDLQAEYMSGIKQAHATEKAKAKAEQAALDMFQLYANLLSINAKYAWNKIVQEQMASDPYTDLQGCSKK